MLGYIMLHCEHTGLLFKYVSPELKRLVRAQAILMFDRFDPEPESSSEQEERYYRRNHTFNDYETRKPLQVLSETGLIDKNMYIILYQKALNRNYDLSEFESLMQEYTRDYKFSKDNKKSTS